MTFVNPAFLWALSVLSIPVIIHLFNFRRYKTVYFPDVRFLKEVKQQTDKTRNLKHLLILAARLLALAFLVLAFAQPFIPHAHSKVAKAINAVSIYIDNSFSLNNTTEDVNLLKQAKTKAHEVVQAFGEADKFQLLTNDFEGRHQQLVNRDEVLNLIDEVNFSPRFKTLNDVAARQMQVLSQAAGSDRAQPYAFLLSDFQSNMLTHSALAYDTTVRVYAVPLKGNKTHNLYIDSAWLDVPQVLVQQSTKVFVRIRNAGDVNAYDVPLQLKIDGLIKSVKKISINENNFIVDTLNFTPSKAGYLKAELSITDYPITFDDTYYLSIEAIDHLPVLNVYEGKANKYVQAVFDRPLFQYTAINVNSLNYSTLNKYACIVFTDVPAISSGLTSVLQKYLEDGGRVVIFPPAKDAANGYNTFLQQANASTYGDILRQKREGASVNTHDNIFKKVFSTMTENVRLPIAQLSYSMERHTRAQEEDLITFKDGGTMIDKCHTGKGLLYISAVPCSSEAGDMPTNSLFAPMLYNMSIIGNTYKPVAYTIGRDNSIEWPQAANGGDAQLHLKKDKTDIIPQQRAAGNTLLITTGKELSEAGIYDVMPANSTTPAGSIAFNYDRRESLMEFATATELTHLPIKHLTVIDNMHANITTTVRELNIGTPLWKYCIALALLFLLAEILLVKFWRK